MQIHRHLLTLSLTWCCSAALAQVAAPPAQTPLQANGQRVERLHVEDAAVKIDEVRYGGESQSITVTPKMDMPAYELVPLNGVRGRAASRDGIGEAGGQRVWNVFKC